MSDFEPLKFEVLLMKLQCFYFKNGERQNTFVKHLYLKQRFTFFGCYFHFIAVLFQNIVIEYKVCEI